MATILDDMLIKLGFDVDSKGADSFQSKLDGMTQGVDKFNKDISGLRNMAMGVGGAIIGVGAMVANTAGSFEGAMNGVRAVSGAAGDEFDALREKAKELGASTAYSATEAANAMEFLAMAGMNTSQILETVPHALNLAAAGNMDLAASADIMSNIMTGMGIAAEESGRVADVLAATAAGANVDVSMMGESMKYVAPVAKQLGMTLEETAAMVGILGNAGIQGSEAGTALRAVYSRLATDNKAKAHFDALGIAITDAQGNMRPMTELLGDLSEATKDMSAADALEVFKDSVGAEAMSAFGVSVDSIADGSLANLIEKLKNAEGSAQEMADIRMEGFDGAMKGFNSAVENLLITIGDSGLLDAFTSVVEKATEWTRSLADMSPETMSMIGKFIAVALAISAVILAIAGIGAVVSGVISAFTGLSAIMGVLGGAIGFLVSPIGLVIAAVVALIAIGYALYSNWDTVVAFIKSLWDSLVATFNTVVGAITTAWNGFWNGAQSIALGVINSIIGAIQNVIGMVGNAIGKVKDLAKYTPAGLAVSGAKWAAGKLGFGGGNSNTVNQTFNVSSTGAATSIARGTVGGTRSRNTGVRQ